MEMILPVDGYYSLESPKNLCDEFSTIMLYLGFHQFYLFGLRYFDLLSASKKIYRGKY
jgi:hypothetical protein